MDDNKRKALSAALGQIEKQFGKGAVMRVTFNDARRGAKAADLCDSCAGGMPGAAVARRGRKPKSLV